jgi:hypothetical protein
MQDRRFRCGVVYSAGDRAVICSHPDNCERSDMAGTSPCFFGWFSGCADRPGRETGEFSGPVGAGRLASPASGTNAASRSEWGAGTSVGSTPGDLYAGQLIDGTEDKQRSAQILEKIQSLIQRVPQADTPALRVMLLQADYNQAETLAVRWINDPADTAGRDQAFEILQRIAPELNEFQEQLNAQVDSLIDALADLPEGRSTRRSRTAIRPGAGRRRASDLLCRLGKLLPGLVQGQDGEGVHPTGPRYLPQTAGHPDGPVRVDRGRMAGFGIGLAVPRADRTGIVRSGAGSKCPGAARASPCWNTPASRRKCRIKPLSGTCRDCSTPDNTTQPSSTLSLESRRTTRHPARARSACASVWSAGRSATAANHQRAVGAGWESSASKVSLDWASNARSNN